MRLNNRARQSTSGPPLRGKENRWSGGHYSTYWKPSVNPWLIAATVALAAFMEVLNTSIASWLRILQMFTIPFAFIATTTAAYVGLPKAWWHAPLF